MAEIIRFSEIQAQRLVPDPDAERLYGEDDAPYIAAEMFPCEVRAAPPEVVTTKAADAVMDFLPDQELNDGDRVEIDGVTFRVLSVQPENLFGAVTHQTANLVRLNGN